jgi:hypothetical protein
MSAIGGILPFRAGGVHVRSWPTAASRERLVERRLAGRLRLLD